MKVVTERQRSCCMCGRLVRLWSATTRNPEAPEMLSPQPGAWLGFVAGDHAPEMVVACSEECCTNLLSH